MSVSEGEEVRLEVQAQGKPLPKLAWFRDGVPVRADAFTKLQASDDRRKLLALGAMVMRKGDARRHAGLYTVEATNCVGTVTHTVPLTGEHKLIESNSAMYIRHDPDAHKGA
jgi:hypothetical protein